MPVFGSIPHDDLAWVVQDGDDVMRDRRSGSLLCKAERMLRCHQYFHGVRDLDETRDLVGKMYCQHRMVLTEKGSLSAWMNAVSLYGVIYSSVGYGASSVVEPGVTGSFFPIMIPQSGGGDVWMGREHVLLEPGTAAVVSATEPLQMRLSRDCTLLILCLDRRTLEDRASELLGEPLSSIRFTLAMDVSQGCGRRWYQHLLNRVYDLSSTDSLLLQHDVLARHANDEIMTSLLLSHRHDSTDRMLADMTLAPSARIVREVIEFVDAHPGVRHTQRSLAKMAHCSVGTLHSAFKHHVHEPPMTYLRKLRFGKAQEKLIRARHNGATVESIAAECGFNSPGWFARNYRKFSGEAPSETKCQ